MIKQRVVKRGNRPHTATAPGTKPMDHCIADQTLTLRQNISISSLINLQPLFFFARVINEPACDVCECRRLNSRRRTKNGLSER